jgi:hypothetical protein
MGRKEETGGGGGGGGEHFPPAKIMVASRDKGKGHLLHAICKVGFNERHIFYGCILEGEKERERRKAGSRA